MREFRRQRFVIGVERRQVGPERGARRAGECREIEQESGLILARARERIGEDQPTFSVSVVDLHHEAFAAGDYVARAEGVA